MDELYASFVRSVCDLTKRERPCLNVFGNFEHFRTSVLGIVSASYFIARPVSNETAPVLPADTGSRQAWIKWDPGSLFQIDADSRRHFPPGVRIINDTNFNCSKENVQILFERVFGYRLMVDPMSYSGKAVVKSSRNAAHDGQVVKFPVQNIDASKVYEKLVQNVCGSMGGESMFCDIRIPIICGTIPFIYLKFRPESLRFSNYNFYAKVVGSQDCLSDWEIDRILAFASAIGLEYGELDVLRDYEDKKIYIVDANNTPYGPPNHIEPEGSDIALRLIAQSVLERFF